MTPLILAVDTTNEYGSLALSQGAALLEEKAVHAPSSFGVVLYDELRDLLDRNRVTLADVACFASAAGPGTFTGVRIGLSCIKGLAEAMGRPAAGVSNLEVLARYGTAPLRAVALDARRGDVYGAVYDHAGRIVCAETVAKIDVWLATLPDAVEEFIVSGVTPQLAGTRFENARIVTPPTALAGVVARIAAERLARGEVLAPAALDANYVRRTDAELALKP
jgi:tRNA threonylcarbamoyladenosine biosynthesis protein TsaB